MIRSGNSFFWLPLVDHFTPSAHVAFTERSTSKQYSVNNDGLCVGTCSLDAFVSQPDKLHRRVPTLVLLLVARNAGDAGAAHVGNGAGALGELAWTLVKLASKLRSVYLD